MTTPTISTVTQFSEKHQAFPPESIRSLLFHKTTNGLQKSGAVIRNGRRILIWEERFWLWLESKNQDKSSQS